MMDSDLYRNQTCPSGAGPYTIRPGDTLYLIAHRYGTTVAAIMSANPGIHPGNLMIGQVICVPGVTPQPPCPHGTIYIIKPGDTLYAISVQYGVSLPALMAANPGIDPNRLLIGQAICIPSAPQRVVLPCCVSLIFGAGAPPEATGDNPAGSLLIRQPAMSTRSLTFSAAGLPDPGTIGNFDSYIGSLMVTEPPETPGPTLRSAVMGAVPPLGDQPTTYAGTTIITELPAVSDTATIRAFNTSTGATSAVILHGDLMKCGR